MKEMPTENNTGIQMRAMAEAQCMENEANLGQAQGTPNQAALNQGAPNPDAPNPAMNTMVDLHRTKEKAIKEFVRQQSKISLHWYVPDFRNTRIGDLIEERLPIETTEGRILFSCPSLSEFFKTSNFELDLRTGKVYTFLAPPEDIGCFMSVRTIRSRTIKSIATRRKGHEYHTRGKTRKNSNDKENSRTSRRYGQRRS